MKVIITGSIDFTDYDLIEQTVKNSNYDITEIICGNRQGADELSQQYANNESITINVIVPDWETNGRSARDVTASEMVSVSDAVFLFWNKTDGFCNLVYKEAWNKDIPIISKLITES